MKITIGRNRKCHIWLNKQEVSDKHAQLWLKDGRIVVQDLNSSNGTFKNDRRILKTELDEGDVLKVADLPIPYNALMRKIEEIQKGNDYSDEFLQLKEIYIKYKQDVQRLKRTQQKRPMVFRVVLSLVPILASIVLWDIIDTSLRYIIMVGGSSLVFGVTSLLAMGQEKEINEKLESLSDDFQIKYVCPKCKTRQGMVSWVVLSNQKRCKSCGAIWVK